MERKVNIQDWQKVTVEDFNNFGLFPRASFDHIVGDVLIPDMAYTGFTTVQTAPAVVTVGSGRLYHNGLVFYNDSEGGTSLDLLSVLPVVTRRYVGVVVWGQETETDTEPRTFLTDPVTRATVARVVSTENRRWCNISSVMGPEGPDPQKPAIASNTLVVCWVLLDSSGVVSITMVDENRAPNLRDLNSRMNENDAWRTRTASRLDTLATDMAALAARLNGTASMRFTMKIAADVARVKEKTGLPDNYTFWGADHFLTTDESDVGPPMNVDYHAEIEEGIRFPFEQQKDSQMFLLNPLDEGVINQANFVLPKYNQVTRLEVLGNDSELSISQYQFQTISWELCTKTRTRIRWGTAFYVCANGVWWFAPSGRDWVSSVNSGQEGWNTAAGGGLQGMTPNTDLIYDPVRNILTRGNETFQILDVQDNPNHTITRLVQFWVDEIIDSYYWRQIVTIEGLSGSVVSQTFLNSQGGWLTSADVFFTRIAASGDVHALICECLSNGAPDYQKTIARASKTADLLRIQPNGTRFEFLPTYLAKGKRYALVLQTSGNHFISLVHNNKFAQGSLFTSTDGAWAMGDMTKDFAFRLQFAQFVSNRVYAQLAPLELGGGIAEIDLNYDSTRPPGTSIQFEVQINGVWKPLASYYEGSPLGPTVLGLPALLQFRVLFTGTTDEMPGIGVAFNSRALTSRRSNTFKHISTARTMPTAVNTVYCDFRLESWRGGTVSAPQPYHTFIPRLLVGAGYSNVRTPSLIQDEIDPDDPTTVIRSCTWNLAALGGTAVTAYKIRCEGTTDNKLSTFLVGERIDIGVFI
jgi:hypothetical protein